MRDQGATHRGMPAEAAGRAVESHTQPLRPGQTTKVVLPVPLRIFSTSALLGARSNGPNMRKRDGSIRSAPLPLNRKIPDRQAPSVAQTKVEFPKQHPQRR